MPLADPDLAHAAVPLADPDLAHAAAPSTSPDRPWRVAALLTHPIQYLVPLMRRAAQHPAIDLTVYFMTDIGLRERYIEGFGHAIKWDIPLLDGYRHELLVNRSPRPDTAGAMSKLNPGIVTALARGGYDALFMHGYACATEWVAYAAAKALGIPILFWGDVLVDSKVPLTRSGRLRRLFRGGFVRGVDAALAQSTQARRFYEHQGVPPGRIFWAPLCVDQARWAAEAQALRPRRAELRREIGADPDVPAIAYVAHMRANKRPKDVVQALERMRTPASLIMAGSGPMFDDLARYCTERGLLATGAPAANGQAARSEPSTMGAPPPGAPSKLPRVHLLGTRNQTELGRVYAMADVFVLPSGPGEVTPLVVQEAMCAGLPLVTSDAVPSNVDFVREGENGFTFPVGDIDALAARLDAVLGDAATQARMSARSREIIAPWNYDVTVAGIADALESLPARRGSHRARERGVRP